MSTARLWGPILLLLPAVAWVAVFVVSPLLVMAYYSLHDGFGASSLSGKLTLASWREFFSDDFYAGMLGRTVQLAGVTTLISLVLGYLPALALLRAPTRWRTLLMVGLILPMWIAYIVRTMSWITVLGRQGLVNTALMNLGVINEPLRLLYTDFSPYIGLVHYVLPIMILNLFIGLQSVDAHAVEAARTLGANRFQAFWQITLPLSLPGLWAGCLLSFILSAGAYVTPMLLGGPSSIYYPYLIYQSAITELNWPFTAVLALVLLAFLTLVLGLYGRYLGLAHVLRGRG